MPFKQLINGHSYWNICICDGFTFAIYSRIEEKIMYSIVLG